MFLDPTLSGSAYLVFRKLLPSVTVFTTGGKLQDPLAAEHPIHTSYSVLLTFRKLNPLISSSRSASARHPTAFPIVKPVHGLQQIRFRLEAIVK